MKEFKTNIEQITELTNVKSVFNEIDVDFDGCKGNMKKEWRENGEIILEFCKDCSTTFVKDICEKALEYKNLSEKQRWCVAFEFLKIKHMFEAWNENN